MSKNSQPQGVRLVNKIIEDIEDESPLSIAKFKKPIVPVVCNKPIIVISSIPLLMRPLLTGTIDFRPCVIKVHRIIKIPTIQNRHPPIRNGGACSIEIKYFPVGNEEPINRVVKMILGRKEDLFSIALFIATPSNCFTK